MLKYFFVCFLIHWTVCAYKTGYHCYHISSKTHAFITFSKISVFPNTILEWYLTHCITPICVQLTAWSMKSLISVTNQTWFFFFFNSDWHQNNRAKSETLILNYFSVSSGLIICISRKIFWYCVYEKHILSKYFHYTRADTLVILWIVHRVKSVKSNLIHLWYTKNIKHLLFLPCRKVVEKI